MLFYLAYNEKDYKGIVLAYKEFITDNSKIDVWKTEQGSPLKMLRTHPFLELSKQKPIDFLLMSWQG